MRILMYRLDDGEENAGLIAETVTWLKDLRLAAASLLEAARKQPLPEYGESYGESEKAVYVWRKLLPTTSTEWLQFREEYGWTREEIESICHLLYAWEADLIIQSNAGTISSTTLRRDAVKVKALIERWRPLSITSWQDFRSGL